MRKAILFAVGNTIVSDTLDAARDLCFGSGEDKKASCLLLGYQAAHHRCQRFEAKGKRDALGEKVGREEKLRKATDGNSS